MAPIDPDDPLSLETAIKELQDDPVFLGEAILVASASLNHEKLDELLRKGSANVRDPSNGLTPIHAAVGAFDGLAEETQHDEQRVERLEETLKLLFLNGAIWNDLNPAGETPGDVAWRLGLKMPYQLIVDAGVRAELLLAAMDEYQELEDEDEDEDEEYGDKEQENKLTNAENSPRIEAGDHATEVEAVPTNEGPKEDVNSKDYLASTLRFSSDRILDADANAVMMAWEKGIMKRSANLLAPGSGLRVLNVGAGMSIIDDFFQEKAPKEHHIIEAHPDVIARLRKDGWHEKPGVTIHEGRWQDVIPGIVADNIMFDAIYFDTFAEDYSALREFFSENVIQLLDPAGGTDGEGGAFGFFHGLGADRQVVYDVYTQVVEIHLNDAGLDVSWEDIQVANLDESGEWTDVKRKYWVPKTYRLPTCRFIG